jgi:threonine/homoserine/homoserine lactone efflux protein
MLDSHIFSANLAVAYTAYLIGVASPGPSNLAIMGTAMAHGRKHAIALAGGVISGSLLWGVLAAFGLASLMRSYSAALILIKVVGGGYLLWLSWTAAKAAYSAKPFEATAAAAEGYRRTFVRGAAMHITNPKAIFVWLSIVSLALPQNSRASDAMTVVAGCGLIGALVFSTYAIAFSTQGVRRAYKAIHKWFNATLSCVFAYAGIRMLLSGQSR